MPARATITVVSAVVDMGLPTEATVTSNYIELEVVAYIDTSSDNQWVYETIPLGDVRFNLVEKNLTDTTTLTEEKGLDLTKPEEETISLLETFARVVAYKRDFNDAFTLDDLSQIDKDFYGNKGNIFSFTDIVGLTHEKDITDSYTVGDVFTRVVSYVRSINDSCSFTDSSYTMLTKIITDSVTMGDSLRKDITGVSDTDTLGFSEIVASSLSKIFSTDQTIMLDSSSNSINKGTSDLFSFGDNSIYGITKVITDAFALDDSALVDKDYYGNKGNICTMSDVIVVGLNFTRDFTDSFSFNDEASYQFGKSVQGAGEVFSISDLVALATISGKVLNGAQINRITLN